MNPPYCFTLIHSPLVGPLTWSFVAAQLVAQNVEVLLPELSDDRGILPYWQRQTEGLADFFSSQPCPQPTVLVAHSGAGPLLPAIRAAINAPVAAYLFVDAGIPIDGYSRLELMALESPAWAGEFRQFLEAGGQFPQWSDEQLREIVPEAALRRQLLAELRPRALDFFTEPIPVFQGWPEAPCGYIRLSPAYDYPYAEAKRRGWAAAEIKAGHFHMLVEPKQMAEVMLEVISRLV